MIYRVYSSMFAGIVSLCVACGDDAATDTGASTSTSVDATGPEDSTTSGSTSAGTDVDTSATSGGDTSSGESSEAGSSTATTTTDSTTGDPSTFERFTLHDAAGPCAPKSDCDGFVELLASGQLRVERFGDVTKTVTEVEISEEDFVAAVAVFTDPALLALLDGADPICEPPTDIFESMEVEIDGTLHDAATTDCNQRPLAAARATAEALAAEYAP